MSRIGLLTLLVGLAARAALAQDAAPAAGDSPAPSAPPAAEQPAAQAPGATAPAPSPEAVAARGAFDALHRQWKETVDQISTAQEQRRAAQGEARAALDKQAADLIEQITDAGLAVYKADPKAYKDVNDTLLAVARFHLTGGPTGDGGDQ